jgi:hypothetical protein
MAPSTIQIEALVDDSERPVMAMAQTILERCLEAAGHAPPPDNGLSGLPPLAIITSLLSDANSDEPVEAVDAAWRTRLEALRRREAPVFICTVFRHVPDRPADGRSDARLERIRRLNSLAPHLSRAFDIFVIDLDRALAHVGARALKCDYRLLGAGAEAVAGHAVAWSLLNTVVEDRLEPAVLEKARAMLGSPARYADLYLRRLGTTA